MKPAPDFTPAQAVQVFKALADPTRYEMVRMLLNCTDGEMGCSEFDQAFDLSKPAMSHHYRVLENAGLVTSRKAGQRVYYRLAQGGLERILPGFTVAHR